MSNINKPNATNAFSIIRTVDIEDAICNILWSTEKADYLISSLEYMFSCPDLNNPSDETMQRIKAGLHSINVCLSMLSDVIGSIHDTAEPINLAISTCEDEAEKVDSND